MVLANGAFDTGETLSNLFASERHMRVNQIVRRLGRRYASRRILFYVDIGVGNVLTQEASDTDTHETLCLSARWMCVFK